jgi:hypothetical protein
MATSLMPTTIRSRSNKSIGDTLETKWTIVAKRVIAEPTPRTQFEAPRQGIYDYDVVPLGKAAPVNDASGTNRTGPAVSFRRIS